MYKQQIIEAIQEQKWLRITFQKKKDKQHVTRIIAPYDIFPQKTEDYKANDRLLGYTKAHENYKPGVISLYLDNILSVSETGEYFDGPTIRRLIKPKEPPYIQRYW